MNRQLQIDIQCGEKTCAWKKGKFCYWFGTTNFGTQPYCHLFSERLGLTENGWTARCKECLKYDNNKENINEPF
jgi:hypothetical protein